MKRGEVYWAMFSPRSGSEQQGIRPALLISGNSMNQNPAWNSLLVIPITTRANSERPTLVSLPIGAGNLPSASFAICHQITTLDRSKFRDYIGELDSKHIAAVEQGLLAALGIEDDS
jgi:mRNA interferase MazF